MAGGSYFVLNPPPWVPPPYLLSGAMYEALEGAAAELAASAYSGGDIAWTKITTSRGEATVVVAIDVPEGVAFGDGKSVPDFSVARRLGL